MLAANESQKSGSEIIHSRSSSISESLINYIAEEESDLVVAGTRGLGGFKRMLLGSVSSHLVSHSPCPVLVVRKPEGGRKIELKRILVASDGSENASRAVALATSLARAVGGKLTFVNVVYLPPTSYPVDGGAGFDKAMEGLSEDAERITIEAGSFAKRNGVEAVTKIVDEFQSPVVAITKLARKGSYDLIVVGTRGLGGFKKLALGSVASGVVHYAHCSVLVAK